MYTKSTDSYATKLTYLHDTCIHINFIWAFSLYLPLPLSGFARFLYISTGLLFREPLWCNVTLFMYRLVAYQSKCIGCNHSNPRWKFNLHWSNNTRFKLCAKYLFQWEIAYKFSSYFVSLVPRQIYRSACTSLNVCLVASKNGYIRNYFSEFFRVHTHSYA